MWNQRELVTGAIGPVGARGLCPRKRLSKLKGRLTHFQLRIGITWRLSSHRSVLFIDLLSILLFLKVLFFMLLTKLGKSLKLHNFATAQP